jgi:NAD(P)-dependent dehydrogenase (short-subunit alcohol dehydrogenase family)
VHAGRQQSKPSILDISTEEFDATMKTNIYAPFWIIKAALPASSWAALARHRSKPTIRRQTFMTMRRPRRRSLRQVARQVACSQGHPRQRGGAGTAPLQISGGAPEQKYENFVSMTVFGRPGQPVEIDLCAACSRRL